MWGNRKELKGEAANEFLQGAAKAKTKTVEQRLGDISYQLHLLNENLYKLINKL